MEIGTEKPAIVVEPVEDPFLIPQEKPTERPVEVPEREKVGV